VLEYLEDQLKDKPSEELLNRLNWTEEQLRAFHAKWKKMSEESKQPQKKDEDGKDYWSEALKSIGLRPNLHRNALQENQTKVKDNQSVTEGRKYAVPPALRERAKTYNSNVGE
jgi:hypothetical protein